MLDFSVWDEWLQRYVDRQGRVNYAAWQQESAQSLRDWLEQLAVVGLPPNATVNEQLAFWLNLYNALTIAQVLERYPIPSIQPKILGIPNWFSFLRFFLRPIYPFQGQRYSLNQIEHGVLRPQFHDPRIHFALVCASLGCPFLRHEAYQPEQVQAQLQNDADRFIHNPAKVRYDAQTGVLYCSRIFKWYRPDFLQLASSIPAYIGRYLDAPLNDTTAIQYLPYDWSLNRQT